MPLIEMIPNQRSREMLGGLKTLDGWCPIARCPQKANTRNDEPENVNQQNANACAACAFAYNILPLKEYMGRGLVNMFGRPRG